MLEQKFIQSVAIQWDKINYDSYLKNISALQFENELHFCKNITFLLEKMGQENQLYWKQLQLLMALIQKVGLGSICFLHMIHIPNCIMQLE